MLKDGKYPHDTDSDGFPGRLREALQSYGSTSAIAKEIGRSEGAVRKWLRGQSEPSVSDLRAICYTTGVSVEWLVMGRGNKQGATGVGRNPPAPYGELPALDYTLMDGVLVAVKLEPRIDGVPITLDKCSSILTTVYNMSRVTRQVDPEAAERVAGLLS
jgi:transcriptional regulator with XRE-family HTH domain